MTRPRLAGKRVLVARPAGQGESAARLLREAGAVPVVIPAIAVGPPDDVGALTAALAPARLAATDWVVFTSANGVDHTCRVLMDEGRRDALASIRVAVVGTATADALRAHGVEAGLVADEFRGEGVAKALLFAIGARPARVLVLRAQEASDVLPGALRAAGVVVDVVAAYRTRAWPEGAAAIARLLVAGELDVVILSSGSTVRAICDALGGSASERLARVTVVCIGPVTAAEASARGVRVDVVPEVATFAGAVQALAAHADSTAR